MGEPSELGGDWGGERCWNVEAVERGLAVGVAVVIDVPLGEGGAKPAKERAATGVGGKRRAALAIDLTEAVELGVEGVSKIVAEGARTRDGDSCLGKGSSVKAQETLPGDFAAEGAGVGESELGEVEGAEEGGFLGIVGGGARREAAVELRAHRGESDAELLQGKTIGFRFRRKPELLDKVQRESGEERCLIRDCCGFLRGW